MSEEGATQYEKRKATMIATRFGGDEAAYDAWMSERMKKIGRVGGKKSGNRPFRDPTRASAAGKVPRRKKADT